MQLFETLFLTILAIAIFRLIVGPIHPCLRYSFIAVAGVVIIFLGAIIEIWRWQRNYRHLYRKISRDTR